MKFNTLEVSSKGIQISISLRRFMPSEIGGAMLYNGSLIEGDCREDVTYLIFNTPTFIEPVR